MLKKLNSIQQEEIPYAQELQVLDTIILDIAEKILNTQPSPANLVTNDVKDNSADNQNLEIKHATSEVNMKEERR